CGWPAAAPAPPLWGGRCPASGRCRYLAWPCCSPPARKKGRNCAGRLPRTRRSQDRPFDSWTWGAWSGASSALLLKKRVRTVERVSWSEVDDVAAVAGGGVGVQEGLAQRAGPAVVAVGDVKRTKGQAVLHRLQVLREGPAGYAGSGGARPATPE